MTDTENEVELTALDSINVITITPNGCSTEEQNPLVTEAKLPTIRHIRQKSSDSSKIRTRILVDGFSKHTIDQQAELRWEDLCLEVRLGRKKSRKKAVLKCVSGSARPGQLTCIVGQPGSGKTSLLNCLTSYSIQGVEGNIYVNGSVLKKNKFRGLRAYVPEKSYLLPDMSTEETLGTAIDLKAPRHLTPEEKKAHLIQILEESGLSECRKVRCEQLTIDSKRRLCMVQELVGKPPPPLIILDHPTRGMGSASSLWCIEFLRRFARCGHTIVVSIPRPSAFILNQFDQLYILSEGRCIYGGPVAELIPYLSERGIPCPEFHSPVDHAIQMSSTLESQPKVTYSSNNSAFQPIMDEEVSNTIRQKEISEIEEDDAMSMTDGTMPFSCIYSPIQMEDFKIYPASRSTQFFVLTLRTLRLKWRNQLTTAYRVAAHIICSTLLGLLYFGVGENKDKFLQNNSFLILNIFFLTLTAMVPTIFTVPREVVVFLQEQTNTTYSASVSLLARTIAELPFQIFLPIISGSLSYWISSQPPEADRFLQFLVFCILTSLVAQTLALVIAIAVPDVQTGLLATIALVVPLLLFSGFFKPVPEIPHYLHWISYLSFIRFAYEGVLMTIYSSSPPTSICNQPECPPPHMAPFLPIGISSITQVPLSENWRNILALTGFLILFRFMSYGALKWKLYFR